ncbi:aldo/keto reductase [Flavobacterium sp.]|uniref:aldo/keto reductase n=1 Tax=Flavobacterium sp. TaxID=239 RepID=UPI0012203318|nr:aldo/keto reductase [Flavobacterium sp.]RZJ73247.1 MAG: aldo/keto reductase [Flavobacterium sp.]
MNTRRTFLTQTSLAAAALAAKPFESLAMDREKPQILAFGSTSEEDFKLVRNFGIGGVAAGNGFHENPDGQIQKTLEAAWNAGVRYYDTSPFYGFGLSERRMGHFLFGKKREEFVLSTKVGRVFKTDPNYKKDPKSLWFGQLNFKFEYDYSASGIRRSIEDSLQRLGLSSIDTVFIHDLSPDNADMGEKWKDYFEIAKKGAFPELTKMREEGLIKSWGLGVNTPQPILEALKVSDPDVMLVATQYSLAVHEPALHELFPAMQKKGVKAVIGAPLNAGFLAGRDRFNYGPKIPQEMLGKRKKMQVVADKHKVDLRSAALQFSASHPVVAAVIPGASTPEQALANAKSMTDVIPSAFWDDLKSQDLISKDAPVPKK